MNELEIKNSGKIVATKQNPNKKWVSVESLKKLKGSSITTVYGLLKELEKYD